MECVSLKAVKDGSAELKVVTVEYLVQPKKESRGDDTVFSDVHYFAPPASMAFCDFTGPPEPCGFAGGAGRTRYLMPRLWLRHRGRRTCE